MNLTLCCVVRNEAPRILRCLDSCAGLIDELVLLDNASTDATAELAAGWAQRQWIDLQILRESQVHGYPEPHRQRCYDAARGKWILVLDGDEWLTEEGRVILPALLGGGTEWWRVGIRTTICNDDGSIFRVNEDYHPRFWRARCNAPHRGTIHCDAEPRSSVSSGELKREPFLAFIEQRRSMCEQERRDGARGVPGRDPAPPVYDGGKQAWRGDAGLI